MTSASKRKGIYWAVALVIIAAGVIVMTSKEADYLTLDQLDDTEQGLFIKGTQQLYTGEARYYREDGSLKQQAQVVDGKLHGSFVSYNADGNVAYKVDYKHGKQDGVLRVYTDDGRLNKEVPYKDGKLNGTEEIFGFEDGLLSESIDYLDGEKHGVHIKYWAPKVKSYEIHFEHGKENGLWTRYTGDNNMPLMQGMMVDGAEEGKWTHYFDGTDIVKGIAHFKAGVLHGDYVQYYQDGVIEESGHYDNGKRVGLWQDFYDNGAIEWERHFNNDELDGLSTTYYRDGRLESQELYRNGERLTTNAETTAND